MQDTFKRYGYDYQTKILSSLMQDSIFFGQVVDILSPQYFSNEGASFLIQTASDYFVEHKKCPTLLVFKTELENLDDRNKVLKEEAKKFLRDSWVNKNSTDLDYVKTQTLNFCKNQELKQAILTSADLLKSSDYDGIKQTLDKALKVGMNRDIGHNYKEEAEQRYEETNRDTTETPWEVINDLTQGGLAGGELGVVVAPPGAGKSWVLAAIGAGGVKKGLNVVHYTLELNKFYTGLRYDSIITGVNNSALNIHKDHILDVVKQLPGNLIIEEYPTKSASLLTLKAHLDRCKIMNFEPDVIIVDYADLLKGNAKELRLELRGIYEGLRNIAGEYNCPVWTASQSNRSSIDSEVVDATAISEDISKAFTGDFILSMARRTEDKLADTAMVHIIKNRFGPDGLSFPSKFNAANGNIQIFKPTSHQAIQTRQDRSEGSNQVRNDLKRKYYDFFKEKQQDQ